MSNVPSGKLVLLNTLNMCKAGDSVRIVGIWKGYDKEKGLGLLCYKECNAEVSLALIVSELPREGDTVQCIGEIMEEDLFGTARVQARTVRVVNTLDMDLYEKDDFRVVFYDSPWRRVIDSSNNNSNNNNNGSNMK